MGVSNGTELVRGHYLEGDSTLLRIGEDYRTQRTSTGGDYKL